VLGVVDGASPLGVETDADIAWRKDLLCKKAVTAGKGRSPKLHRPQLTLPRIERDEEHAGIAAKIAARQSASAIRAKDPSRALRRDSRRHLQRVPGSVRSGLRA
jgi:hypothetical protein